MCVFSPQDAGLDRSGGVTGYYYSSRASREGTDVGVANAEGAL